MRTTSFALPAVLMRGGGSRGLVVAADALPAGLMQRPEARDAFFARLLGSPDPSGRQLDGLGGATDRVVVVQRSRRDDCDVEFAIGRVACDAPRVDWSSGCGDLAAAVAAWSIQRGWVTAASSASKAEVRVWQQGPGRRVVAHVPVQAGAVVETGGFEDDATPFPGNEIRLEFLAGVDDGPLLPTRQACDALDVPELAALLPARNVGPLRMTCLDVGQPVAFVRADALGLTGRESPEALNRDRRVLQRLEPVRVRAAIAMKRARDPDEVARRRVTGPILVLLAAPAAYRTTSGIDVEKHGIDLLVRVHASGSVRDGLDDTVGEAVGHAVAIAAALPGTLVGELARTLPGVPTRIGHPAGVRTVGAVVESRDGRWAVDRTLASRSARRLMDGVVHVPWSAD